MQIELGTRVVRGPDWIWSDQDGEEGMVGTVIQTKTEGSLGNAGSVKVLWDHGGQGIYRCGENNACDLLAFCSPIVSKHGVGCDICLKDIIGTSWNCQDCPLTHLCTYCYMGDKHNIQHSFERFDTSDKPGVPLQPRGGSLKIEAKGFFPGAIVVRGFSWEWDDQDGGDGQVGNVTEIQEFHSKYRRNVARVQWIGNGISNVYRIGHNGKVDVKCVKPAGGSFYYKQHMPVLGKKFDVAPAAQAVSTNLLSAAASNFPMDITPPSSSMFQQEASANNVNLLGNEPFSQDPSPVLESKIPAAVENITPSLNKFAIGDRVKIMATKESCMSLQSGHGGWHPSMDQDIGKIGVVQYLTEKNDVTVAFEESSQRWTLNPILLKKIQIAEILKEGDSVKLISDGKLAKRLYEAQVREWTDDVGDCLGNIGKITKKFLDGNLRISIGQNTLIVPEDMVEGKLEQIIDLSIKQGTDVSQEIKLMQAAKSGDISEVRELLDSHPHDVNTPSLEGTPLTAAIFEEREDVVKYLMDKGADINILDKNKHTAVHLAFSVGNEDIIKAVMSSDHLDIGILSGKSNLDYLQFAAVCGSVTGTKLLLKRYKNLINRPSSGPAPLHYAVISCVELASFLITEAGFDINVRDLDQRTPLHVAIMTCNLRAAMFLIEAGADINLCDYRGNTALHMIVSLQDRQSLREHSWYSMILKRYIGRKDQLRIENKDIVKKLFGSLDMKKSWYSTDAVFGCFLINNGADPYIKNSNRLTPFASGSRNEVVDMIRKFYEKMNSKSKAAPASMEDKNMPSSISSEDSIGSTDCRLCRESSSDAVFEPCGHTITCIGCAIYFCKCFACEEDVISFSKKNVATDCFICDANIADVLFEPCKHIVCCSGCAGRMLRCVYCKATITQKFDKNLQPLLPPSDAESAKYDELLNSLRNLEAKVREIESANTCTICMDRPKNIMFLCGHGTCDICSPSLEVCPICRDPIEKKIPMF